MKGQLAQALITGVVVWFHLATVSLLPAEPTQNPVTQPQIQLTAEGENSIQNGIASAEKNVELLYGDTALYCDKLTYDTNSGWATAVGNVRIYGWGTAGVMWVGQQIRFNMKTREIDGDNLKFVGYPFVGGSDKITSEKGETSTVYKSTNNLLSLENKEGPGFKIKVGTLTFDPTEYRYVMNNAVLYAGSVPVLWLPSLVYDPGGIDNPLQFIPGYSSEWGAFALIGYGFEINPKVRMKLHMDIRSERGYAGGADLKWIYGKRGRTADEGTQGQGRATVYFAEDNAPEKGGSRDEFLNPGRYRMEVEQRSYFTVERDLYADLVVNKQSDAFFERDFFESEYRKERQPDNYASVVKYDPNFTFTLLARQQVNDFYETVEREPELSFEIKRQNLLPGSALEYNGQTSFTQFNRKYSNEFEDRPHDYDAARVDTYHQLSFPKSLGGWLNFNPRAGVRATYYSDSVGERDQFELAREGTFRTDDADGNLLLARGSGEGHALMRLAFNTGFEMSFKMSRTWDRFSEQWGINQLRHVIEPFLNFSYMPNPSIAQDRIMQFDGRLGSTRLQPLDFPQYNSIDSLDNQLIARTGFRQKWQTQRDGQTWDILEWDTYIDFDFEGQYYQDNLTSNLYNEISFNPVPWMRFQVYTSTSLYDDGFSEYNTSLTWQLAKPLEVTLSTRYLNGHPLFENRNDVSLSWFWRLDNNWSLATRHSYDVEDARLSLQEYSVYRDFTAWRMSLTAQYRDNQESEDEVAFYLTMTLKAFPETRVPLGYRVGNESPITIGD